MLLRLWLLEVLLEVAGTGTIIATAFAPSLRWSSSVSRSSFSLLIQQQENKHLLVRLCAQEKQNENDEKEDETEKHDDDYNEVNSNPYADPNYPDLEFLDYSDPEYQVDMGMDEEFFPSSNSNREEEDMARLEAMREDRRRRNDEYQFQTYYANILKQGQEFKGEWTLYKTSTFLKSNNNQHAEQQQQQPPRLVKAANTFNVISKGSKIRLEHLENVDFPVDRERILHCERVVTPQEMDKDFGAKIAKNNNNSNKWSPDEALAIQNDLIRLYCPESLAASDFRGPQGIMVVSNAYTLATAVPLNHRSDSSAFAPVMPSSNSNNIHKGPFAEYCAEVGLTFQHMRFRVKLDYAVLDNPPLKNKINKKKMKSTPPLHLRSLVVCRELQGDLWPQSCKYSGGGGGGGGPYQSQSSLYNDAMANINEALFGVPGADNGLYDPPPICRNPNVYLQLDLDGHATALFPYQMDQEHDDDDDDENMGSNGGAENMGGWVISLDWMPGAMRYQVDRKFNAGADLLGLRTLELSEVQSINAERYRPRDGGANMRQ